MPPSPCGVAPFAVEAAADHRCWARPERGRWPTQSPWSQELGGAGPVAGLRPRDGRSDTASSSPLSVMRTGGASSCSEASRTCCWTSAAASSCSTRPSDDAAKASRRLGCAQTPTQRAPLARPRSALGSLPCDELLSSPSGSRPPMTRSCRSAHAVRRLTVAPGPPTPWEASQWQAPTMAMPHTAGAACSCAERRQTMEARHAVDLAAAPCSGERRSRRMEPS
mmetsp:Transcript_34104/g.98325  ORF Transcript_34104/g.98325 Transcript_34104/m.98325 type:complete len:223 (+) Transcript_34104:293-961(+)